MTKLKREIDKFKPVLEISQALSSKAKHIPSLWKDTAMVDTAIPPLDIDPREIKICTQKGWYNNVHSGCTHSTY